MTFKAPFGLKSLNGAFSIIVTLKFISMNRQKAIVIFGIFCTSCSAQTKTEEKPSIAVISKPDSSDTLKLFISSTKNASISYQDMYGNDQILQSGENVIIPPVVVYEGEKQAWYIFKHGGKFNFQKDSLGYWLAKSKTGKDDNFVNFFVAYRKQVEPFLVQKYMSSESMVTTQVVI
jgi:hypothetical protein